MTRKDINLIAEAYGALTPGSGRFEGKDFPELKWDDSWDDMTPPNEEVDAEQLNIGIEVEKEHTDDEELAEEIARDHLAEDPHYYTKLKKAGL
jgi:hypothetical protein